MIRMGRDISKRAVERALGRKLPKHARGPSKLEVMLDEQIARVGLPKPKKNHQFDLPHSKMEVDYAWLPLYGYFKIGGEWKEYKVDPNQQMIAFEVEGMCHRIKGNFLRDIRKHNRLIELGWVFYRLSGDMVRDGSAIKLVERVLKGRA